MVILRFRIPEMWFRLPPAAPDVYYSINLEVDMNMLHEMPMRENVLSKVPEVQKERWDSFETVYVGMWSRRDHIFNDFKATDPGVNYQILLAYYDIDGYDGDAFVLYRDINTGKLYEVHGSHCSCYGLEDQWEPEETTKQALRTRMTEGCLGHNKFEMELKAVLDKV